MKKSTKRYLMKGKYKTRGYYLNLNGDNDVECLTNDELRKKKSLELLNGNG